MYNMLLVDDEQFVYLNWLPVSKRVEQIMLCHVHKIRYGLAPDYLGEHFIPLNTVRSRNTESNVLLLIAVFLMLMTFNLMILGNLPNPDLKVLEKSSLF